MSLSPPTLAALLGYATEAAREAGAYIASARPPTIERKPEAHSEASQVVTEVDRHCQAIILRTLQPTLARFDLAVLAEEQPDDGQRRHRPYFWSIDPLDGTLPFIEGTAGYAVSIALVSRQGVPWLGVVFDPVTGTLVHATRDGGLFVDGEPWRPVRPPPGAALTLFTDRSFATWNGFDATVVGLRRVADDLGLAGLTVHTTGGAVINACNVLLRPPACFFKFPKSQPGGGSLWDYAATACLFHEAGAVASDMHGDVLDLNRADGTFMNHRGVLFASDEALARQIRMLAARRG